MPFNFYGRQLMLKNTSYFLYAVLLMPLSGCSDNSTTDQSQDGTSQAGELRTTEDLIDTYWTMQSIQKDDGSITEIPEEANWRIRFNSADADRSETFEMRFNCNAYAVEYTLVDSVFTTDANSSFSAPLCGDAGITLESLESYADYTLTGNVFQFHSLDASSIQLVSGNNEVFTMTSREQWND